MAKQMSPKEMERANNKVEQSALSKLKKENAELKRQIAFLTGICRRCYSGGSISSSQFDTYSMSKDTICEYCDKHNVSIVENIKNHCQKMKMAHINIKIYIYSNSKCSSNTLGIIIFSHHSSDKKYRTRLFIPSPIFYFL